MAKVGARVHIYGDYDGAGVQKAKRDISTLDSQTKGFSKSFSSSFMGAGAAIGAAFGVGVIGRNVLDFFQDSVTAALADEKAMRSLEIALQNVGAAHQVAPIEKFIDALARESGVADDKLRPSFQRLVTATGDVALSQQNLQLAMDISAGTGRDLEAVTLALARAFTGSTTGLSRLGAGLDANLLKTKDMDKITAALSERFSGQAAAAADTYQGKINKISVAAGEASEQIGIALLEAIDGVGNSMGGAGGAANAITELANGISGLIEQTSDLIQFLTQSERATTKNADANKYSQDTYRKLAGLIPIVGAYLVGLSERQEDSATAAGIQSEANAVLTSRLTGLANAYKIASGAASSFGRFQVDLGGRDFSQFFAVNPSAQKALADAQNNVNELVENYNQGLKDTSSNSVAAAKDTFTFKEALAQVNSEGLEKLNANLKTAQDEFDGFRNSIAGGLTGQLNFADAADKAKAGGTGIVDGITGQANGIVAFGEQLKLLLSTSLSQESFAAVAALSAERGAALATELLGANGAALIAQLNTAVAAVNVVADAVGLQSAEKFLGAGRTAAENTITGFQEYMGKDGIGRKRLMNTMDNLAAAATREARINVLVTRSINEVVTRITQNVSAPIPRRAMGGPVSTRRPYIVGEVGPELFVPSSSGNITPNSALGGSVVNLTVNAGMGADGTAIGEQIVSALRQFQRRNGPLPLTVAS